MCKTEEIKTTAKLAQPYKPVKQERWEAPDNMIQKGT